MGSSEKFVYFKLSSFYFFFFALLGGFAPFVPLYLDDLGFNLYEIGQLTAILMVTKVLAPNLWSWVGDHTGRRLLLVRLGTFFAFICFTGLLFTTHFWWIAFSIAGFSFFWNAVLPQFEVVTLHNLGEKRDRYSLVRVWGSIGFVATVYLLGVFFESASIRWLPWILCLIMLFIWLSSLFKFSEEKHAGHAEFKGLVALVFAPGVFAFFFMNLLLQLSHGPYYTFFSLYLEEIGYSKTTIGAMWALGVLAEVVLFIFMRPLLSRFSLKSLALMGLFITLLRWIGMAMFAENQILLIVIQLGHAASFGIMHIVAIHYVHKHFKGHHEGQGQALYSSLSFGLGGALGAYLSGVLTNYYPFTLLFFGAAVITVIALISAMFSFTNRNDGNKSDILGL